MATTAPPPHDATHVGPRRSGSLRPAATYDPSELDTLGGIIRVLRRSRLTIIVPCVCAVLAGALSYTVAERFTSKAAFVPENRNSQGLSSGAMSLLGLASSFGLAGASAVGPQFYAEVLRSREIEQRILLTRFALTPSDRDSEPLIDLMKIKNKIPARKLASGLKAFDGALKTDVDPRTSIVHVSFEGPSPTLSRDVMDSLLAELNRFNLDRRQSTGRARRVFLEGQTKIADSVLRADEEELRDFYARNRQYQTSPDLQFVEQRLRRKVSLQEEFSTTLKSDLETARLDEVNDAPVITLIDRPFVPDRKSSPVRSLWVIVAFVTGFALTVTFLIARYAILAQLRRTDGD